MSFVGSGQPVAASSSYAPVTYQRLIRLAARAFYSGPCPPPGRDADNTFSARSKIGKMDTRGLGIVLLDYLTTVEWTSFDLLSEALRLHPVLLSRALRFLEAGHMVRRYERRESRRKKRTVVGEALEADVAPEAESESDDEDGAKKKGLLTEYFTIDYARAFDALQVRIHTMRASLKEQLESSNAIQAYRCPGPFCGKTYTSLDAANLVDPSDLTFKCEMCGSELMEQRATNDAASASSDPAAAQHASAKESKEAARRLLQLIDRELAPLTRLMSELQHRAVPLPDPGELFEWAQRVKQRETEMAAAAAAGGGASGGAGGSTRGPGASGGGRSGGGASATPASLLGDGSVTVLSAADNTNTWETQDFKVSLSGGAGGMAAGGGGGLLLGGGTGAFGAGSTGVKTEGAGGDGGKKAPTALPWFLKGKSGDESHSLAAGGAEAASTTSGTGSREPPRAKQQQQAEYFKDFMAYMSQLQQEKRPVGGAAPEPGVKTEAGVAAAAAAGRAAAPAAARPSTVLVKPEPGVGLVPLGPVATNDVRAAPGMAVKVEKALEAAAATTGTAAVAAEGTDMEWEDVGAGFSQPATGSVPMVKTELAPLFSEGAADNDGDVEWEDV